MGRVPKSSGSLLVNGKDSAANSHINSVAFVPQEDIMIPTLTVKEVITHNALIRLPSSWSFSKKMSVSVATNHNYLM